MSAIELKSLIEYHDDLYYNQAAPEITDVEYDALRQQLLDLDEEALDYVPGETTGLFPKYTHTHPIASLAKVSTEEALRKEIEKLIPVIVMPKYDGLSIVTYPDARVTRGNGEIGDDVSVHFDKVCTSIFPIPVRGEAIIKRDDFIALNALRKKNNEEEFKNARNAAAGILRGKDGKYMEFISYVVYEVIGSDKPLSENLALLTDAGFRVTEYMEFTNAVEAADFVIDYEKDDYMFELDGLVIKSNRPDSEKIFGRTGHHPKDAFAFKYESQGEWTKIHSVTNQVGRTGKITPVAELEPFELMGSTISRATLHNYSIVDALKISKGCDVFVVKANDIIPAVIKTDNFNPLNKFSQPRSCPECDSDLELVNDQQFCRNVSCPAKLVGRIQHMAKRDALDIVGLSEQTAIKIIEAGGIFDAEDIFDLTLEQISQLPGFAEKSATNLYQNIQTARTASFDRFMYAVGMPLIGRTASKEMANVYANYDEFLDDYANEFVRLSKVDGFGTNMILSLITNFPLIGELYDKMYEVQFKAPSAAVTGDYAICITGTFEFPRSHYQGLIEKHGQKFISGVTKKTTHLFAGEKAGSKLKKAQELGIVVLSSEQELLDLLEGN